MNSRAICWSCAERARPLSPLRVRLRREEGGEAYVVAVTVAYRKAEISVPLCAPCKKAWRPALRARMVAVWSLTLGIILVPSALLVGLLMVQQYHDGAIFRLAGGIGVGIGAIAAAVCIPAWRARHKQPEGLRHPHSHPDVVALTDSGYGILN
ncbi:hypothetical protein [Streptomyces sp. NPDC046979]|uniref:hypothetical protein n=1 Tax=Streptomyces sp. NPDC046979 TaxID=3154604 RepID=UPI0033E8CB16